MVTKNDIIHGLWWLSKNVIHYMSIYTLIYTGGTVVSTRHTRVWMHAHHSLCSCAGQENWRLACRCFWVKIYSTSRFAVWLKLVTDYKEGQRPSGDPKERFIMWELLCGIFINWHFCQYCLHQARSKLKWEGLKATNVLFSNREAPSCISII